MLTPIHVILKWVRATFLKDYRLIWIYSYTFHFKAHNIGKQQVMKITANVLTLPEIDIHSKT